jgi:hypothetical protein
MSWLENIGRSVGQLHAGAWIVGLAVAAAVMLIGILRLGRKSPRGYSETELRFRNVFAIMSEDQRRSLIDHYAKKHGCNREAAMRHALDDRDREARSWR